MTVFYIEMMCGAGHKHLFRAIAFDDALAAQAEIVEIHKVCPTCGHPFVQAAPTSERPTE